MNRNRIINCFLNDHYCSISCFAYFSHSLESQIINFSHDINSINKRRIQVELNHVLFAIMDVRITRNASTVSIFMVVSWKLKCGKQTVMTRVHRIASNKT